MNDRKIGCDVRTVFDGDGGDDAVERSAQLGLCQSDECILKLCDGDVDVALRHCNFLGSRASSKPVQGGLGLMDQSLSLRQLERLHLTQRVEPDLRLTHCGGGAGDLFWRRSALQKIESRFGGVVGGGGLLHRHRLGEHADVGMVAHLVVGGTRLIELRLRQL